MNNNTGTTTPEVVPLPRVDTDRCADAEMETAFVFAHENGLTTTETCMSARMTDSLTRGEAAKIISNFAMNILDKTPDSSMKCVFSDMIDADSETRTYAKTACQLGLMGLKGDGTPAETFSPNEIVTKAQITTILSRLLWGDENNTIDACRYCQHVKALKEASVINVTTDLMIPLQRGYAMLMIMRIKQ